MDEHEARADARRLTLLQIADLIESRKPWTVDLLRDLLEFCQTETHALEETP